MPSLAEEKGVPRRVDDLGTDRRLRLLVGLVVILAALIGALATRSLLARPPATGQDIQTATALISLVLLGAVASVNIRIRSTTRAVQWIETAFFVGFAVAPAPVVTLCTGIGVAVAAILRQRGWLKSVYSVSKEMVLAGVAGTVATAAGWTGEQHTDITRLLGPLAVAYVVTVLLDELLAFSALSLASGTRISHLYREDVGLRVTSAVARFGVIAATVLTLNVDGRLLIAVPPLVLSLHLYYSNRVRARAEQQAWQRLARTTDALNAVDLDLVLTTAITRAAELFSADEVEIELTNIRRMVRGGESVTYDGPPGPPSGISGTVVPTRLEGHDHNADVGVLRLRFRYAVTLSERERYTLRTFASALCTAIRNAQAYADLSQAAEQHAYAATHDTLTGLPNRRHLLTEGSRQLDQQHAEGVTALLLLDLNHFKEVNDTLGHAAGDRVLAEVADRLRTAAHEGDLVARLGGDEFAVLLRGLPAPAIASQRADALLSSLNEAIALDGMRISVEASGGIATAPNVGGMPELLRRADVAMYLAKRNGQRITTYVPARDTADLGRLTLGGELPRAVADHEFTVNFQPIVDMGTGAAVAAEALARWHHPVHGTIDPLRFLEAVERSGLLPAFAEAVLDQSLAAAVEWRDTGFDLTVAVNVSPRSLLDPRFPSAVMARVRAHGLSPERLCLELTETLTLSQLEVVDRVLGRLRDEGVRLALDDFGTGYSSLSLLSRIPVHELKIDRSFVTDMDNSAEAAAVIRSTLDLGRSLDLTVVAEGVESEPQRRTLWDLGCTTGQGHLFGRPMPAARLLATLQRGTAGRPGVLAVPLQDTGAVIRLDPGRRHNGRSRTNRLPHLPA